MQIAKGSTPLYYALLFNSFDIAHYLLSQGADPNTRLPGGIIPLMLAHDEKIRNLLIKFGANPNHYDENGTVPLMSAAACDHHEGAALLIGLGADPNCRKK